MDKDLLIDPKNDSIIETKLKINQTLKEFPNLSKKEVQQVYENTVNAALYEDLMSKCTGKAIKDIYGEDISLDIASKAAELYGGQIVTEENLTLSDEDEKMLRECLDM